MPAQSKPLIHTSRHFWCLKVLDPPSILKDACKIRVMQISPTGGWTCIFTLARPTFPDHKLMGAGIATK